MESKPIWKSKIFWVNVLTLAVLVFGVFAEDPRYGQLTYWAALALPVVNIVLRFMTNQTVTIK